ncbi:hypothetical protein AnigIFM56816_007213 [Aspergillus niger]|nr:hypothetical protein AnigIFM56816_007213 [Aspergillus niger]
MFERMMIAHQPIPDIFSRLFYILQVDLRRRLHPGQDLPLHTGRLEDVIHNHDNRRENSKSAGFVSNPKSTLCAASGSRDCAWELPREAGYMELTMSE